MTTNEMKARIAEIDSIIDPLKQERRELAYKVAAAECPYVIGDILERKFKWGYTYPPIYRTERAKVVAIRPSSWGGKAEVSLKVIRKDGSLGKHARMLFDSDKWQKVDTQSTSAASEEHGDTPPQSAS